MLLNFILINSLLLLLQVNSSPTNSNTNSNITPSKSTTKPSKTPTTFPKNSTTSSTTPTKSTTTPPKTTTTLPKNSTTSATKTPPVVLATPQKAASEPATPVTGFLCANAAYPIAHCGIVNQQGTIRSVPADIITMHNVTHYSCDEVFQEETLGAYCCQVQLNQGAKYCKAAVIQVLN